MHWEFKYQDRIYLEDDDGNLTLVWQNEPYDERWRGDSHPDSEYNQMMKMDLQYNFVDYDNCPNFVHYLYRIEIKVTKKERKVVKEAIEDIMPLVEEFYDT